MLAPIGSNLAQIAWVVGDLRTTEYHFRHAMGIDRFGETVTIRSREVEGTYYGEPSDAEWLVSIAYAGGTFIELIQPLSGQSIFMDYLDKNPGGGIQHIAYSLPIIDFEEASAQLIGKEFPVITTVNMPVAKIAFFDTYHAIGVITEIIGLTEEGLKFVENMKSERP